MERLLARLVVCMYTYLVCGPFVQLISREISQATSSLTFSTQYLILEIIEDRVSRLEDQGLRDCQLTFEQYCTLLDSLEALNNKSDHIKLTHCIINSSISFRIYFSLETRHLVLQYPTFQKPLNKYLYIPFKSFHPSSNKKAFIKGELIKYARNSSSFKAFTNTREKFWKRLLVRG